jgi:7-cyano-7-deazaguanine synthase
MEGRRVFLALSGGVDSTTLYAFLTAKKALVTPVFFRYPSKHNEMERAAAEQVAARYSGHSLPEVDLSGVFGGLRSGLLRGGPALPDGEYSEENLRLTVVPGRNTVFLAVLAARAESAEGGGTCVALGIHGGDHAVYPDCRPDYIEAARRTIRLASQGKVELLAPFASMSKAEVVRLGLECAAPYELTRSCYAGGDAPCRVCPTCRAREAAFAANGISDPLLRP